MSETRILLTGATGYIGGSVLTALLNSTDLYVKACKLSALVRKGSQAEILQQQNVDPVVFDGLDDLDTLRNVASEHDIVVNAALTYHTPAADALLRGLEDRRKKSGKPVHLIHTSGTSSVADLPVSGAYTESAVFSDKSDIYSYERYRESVQPYIQRTSELLVCDRGEASDVTTYIIMPPLIYGEGTGLFNRRSIQINTIMRAALRDGYASRIGAGEHEWDHVHILDLAGFYELIVARILAGCELDANSRGIYFCQSGHQSWREISDRVARVGYELGFLKSYTVRQVTLQEAAERLWKGWPLEALEPTLASRSQTRADKACELGWRPTKSRKDFEDCFADEWHSVKNEG